MKKTNLFLAIIFYFLGGQLWADPGHSLPLDDAPEPAYVRLAQESGLELDNGQKWLVDKSMMVQFRQLEQELKTFRADGPPSYRRLGKSLQDGLATLVSECTMEGQAHDELHEWLVPFMDDVDDFSEERDQGALEKRLLKLRNSFDVFNAHFR